MQWKHLGSAQTCGLTKPRISTFPPPGCVPHCSPSKIFSWRENAWWFASAHGIVSSGCIPVTISLTKAIFAVVTGIPTDHKDQQHVCVTVSWLCIFVWGILFSVVDDGWKASAIDCSCFLAGNNNQPRKMHCDVSQCDQRTMMKAGSGLMCSLIHVFITIMMRQEGCFGLAEERTTTNQEKGIATCHNVTKGQ